MTKRFFPGWQSVLGARPVPQQNCEYGLVELYPGGSYPNIVALRAAG